ncbi:MAG TPA: type II secretion system F family protein [Tepidisphaeraceae bacterium]|jgi:tight adherence protein C
MTIHQIIFFVCSGGAVGTIAYVITNLLVGKRDNRLYGRLLNERPTETSVEKSADNGNRVKNMAAKFGQAAASPFMMKDGEKKTGVRKQLAMAGIYSPAAIKAVQGFKLICLIGGLTAGIVFGISTGYLFLFGALGGLIGYLTPTMWLKGKITTNQKFLQLGLPDALDLMVVCVEAGLTVDAAMQRVGDELVLAHPIISREFGIAHMETRVGLSRAEALKNMGTRTGNPALQQLVAMLVQAERFGTSIAGALRIQSETLRVKRQHVAEEMAAKASVKMSFPLVLFIFPATFIVLAGPTVLGLFASDLFK